MIKFFRRIRKQLLSENKFSKYLIYAIGEIILVVIGILIALQINEWNQKRLIETGIEQRLNEFTVTLKEERDQLVSIKTHNVFRFHSMKYLLNLIKEKPRTSSLNSISFEESWLWKGGVPDSINKEFIEQSFSWSHRFIELVPNKSVIEEMIDTGLYYEIQNSKLKNKINEYYRLLSNTLPNYEIMTAWDESFLEEGIELVDVSNIADPLSLIKNRPTRIAYLKRLVGNANWLAQNAEQSIVRIDDILTILELRYPNKQKLTKNQ